ncbi:NHLP bacteriocin system secretion protein [Rhodobacteraceae bacterium N5(2021)]|uniref:NHLP bacteriocin system secretion protein n=1 Tax=Gymnodinialimonas phycosphaerae TaxID=2841589 RepID=A0A975TW87_9RHOB|nr:NHLP bacteriocin system secretion protein [Gymnodinialimonas phycosphaerae]
MARKIFRQAALERMASPERLDRPVRLVGASGWLVLLCLASLIGAGVFWAGVTMAPIKVRGEGILIDEAGLVELVSEQGGLLQSIDIAPGDLIEEGQVVARLSRSELRRELAGAQALLADQQERYSQLLAAQDARLARETSADARSLAALERTLEALRARLPVLQELALELVPLAERNVVPQSRLLEAQIAVADLEERISNLVEDAQDIEFQASEREATREFELLEERLAIDERVRVIARLEAQLSEERVIVSPYTGRVVELQVNAGDVLPLGGTLATLTQTGEGRALVALMFVPPEEGKRIEPGMLAEIAPTTVEREVFGHIHGEVIAVSELPATPEGMRRVLQNDQLVQQLSLEGAPIEVRIRLLPDADTETGFAWSASDGPVSGVNAGTLLGGQIVLEERPIIDLVIPGASVRLARLLEDATP